MDSLQHDAFPPSDDLSALAWVSEELRKSLELAHKSLHRCLKDTTAAGMSDVDALDPAVLRTARQQIHQGVGVLELAGLPAGATVLRASEAVIQKMINRPQMISEDVVREIERASFALLDYIAKKLSGKSVSAMAMFHQYEALVSRAGAGMARPTDLWGQDWPNLSLDVSVAPPHGVQPRRPDADTVEDFEMSLLKLFRRNQPADALELAGLCNSLAVDASQRDAARESATWMLASGFLEALAGRHVRLRVLNRGQDVPSDRLASELLFFCAQAGDVPAKDASVLGQVRQTFGLQKHQPVNLSASSLGRFDPAWVAQALKRVGGAKDAWSAVAGGELVRLAGLTEQFTLVCDSLRRLFIEGDVLATALTDAVQQTVASSGVPAPGLAMEVATSLLYMEASLEDGEFDQPEQQPRLQRLAQRIQSVAMGMPAEPLEGWMEDLYRRVSDRHTIGSVVQELRSTLTEAEKHIDQFFRQPQDRTPLTNVPGILQSMRGVLAVLGLDHAAQASVRMRDDVDYLLADSTDLEAAAQEGVFERLASNLGALGFLIDMTAVQPQMAKSLFVLNAETGVLSPVMGREQREISETQSNLSASQQNADQSQTATTDEDASLAPTSAPSFGVELVLPTSVAPAAPAPVEAALGDDDEMREIFLEEAREVIENAQSSLDQLAQQADDLGSLTTVRRAFHTLKGSSRMVGLTEYGEAAWACEQLFNAWLAKQEPASHDLLSVTQELLAHFGRWTDAVAGGQDTDWRHEPVTQVAEALRLRGERLSLDGLSGASVPQSYDLDLAAPPIDDALANAVSESSEFAEPESADLVLEEAVAPEALDFDLPAQEPTESQVNDELVSEPEPELPLLNIADFGIDLDLTASATDAVEPVVVQELVEEPAVDQLLNVNILEPKHVVQLEEDDDPTLAGELYDEADQTEADLPLVLEAETNADSDESVDIPLLAEEGEVVEPPSDEQFKQIGDLRISISLFNIYLNEADEQSRRLSQALSEWGLEVHKPVSDEVIALAHSLAGNSGTVGFAELSQLARLLEHALMRCQSLGQGDQDAATLFSEVAEEIRRLLHQFAAGFLKSPAAELMARLEDYEHEASRRYEARILEAEQPVSVTELEPEAATDLASEVQAEPAVEVVSAQEVTPLGLPEFKTLDELPASAPISAGVARPVANMWDEGEAIDAVDSVDLDLFPVFEEEALELLPQLGSQVRAWLDSPGDATAGTACMRTLHTFKGGARLAGAMRLGELAHRLESTIEHLLANGAVQQDDVAPLEARVDRLMEVFDALRQQDAKTYEEGVLKAEKAADEDAQLLETPAMVDIEPREAAGQPRATPDLVQQVDAPALGESRRRVLVRESSDVSLKPVDWSTLEGKPWQGSQRLVRDAQQPVSQAAVRVRPQILDRLVNHAGEASIARSRLSSQVGQIRNSINDLTENLERLRLQLRDIELQADTQMSTRMEAARAASQEFDPLEFDRYTRFQELTRMMAESVNDVATVQRTLQRSLETAEDQLAVQARLMRDLQDDLLRTRMVEFEGLSDRLYRVVRQAAKETGKQVRLDILGGATEVDRGVLERLTGAFEHLLRNCISHGVEMPETRVAAGKDPAGQVTVALRQEGNEVAIEFRDDGAGLNLPRIRQRAVSMGLLPDNQSVTDAELAQFIFMPGFSTFDKVTELAGRGIGMDVVRSEINAMGGRIETATSEGRGTSFTLIVPLTTAVTKVVMMRCGAHTVAVPTHLIEIVKRAKPDELAKAYECGSYVAGDQAMPFYWLGALLNYGPRSHEAGRTMPLVIIRSAQQRVALHVDEVLGNQEVVVKNLGVQMSRLPGLAGMTLLASGAVALIYNPVALATVYGAHAHSLTAQALSADQASPGRVGTPGDVAGTKPEMADEPLSPLVLVVDDSLTVRRVTQRLLTREGYRVTLAKDGLEALEALALEKPAVVLSDIEMPRMDGFDLVRNIRSDSKISDIPIIMITSRIAQKHRDYAQELGVNHYLGKPYGEDELLELVGRYTAQPESAHA